MFAVPGWSVSLSSLKTQTASPTNAAATPKPKQTDGEAADPVPGRSRKRKRGRDKPNGENVTPENLADLWEKHIEGKTDRQVNSSKRPKKDEKDEPEHQRERKVDGESPKDPFSTKEKFEKRKTLKEKRREKKAQLQATGDAPPSRPQVQPQPTTAPTALPAQGPAQAPKAASPPAPLSSKLTPLQASMRQKLTSARFRYLNQTLYTTPSSQSLELFAQNPEMFEEYHEGFRRQVDVWPENPVDGYIEQLKQRGALKFGTWNRQGKGKGKKAPEQQIKGGTTTTASQPPLLPPLPRTDNICTIADLGCGDARLAQSLQSTQKKLKIQIHSYDLHSPNALITACDISALPLAPASVDIAICCLALMGSNWISFIEEAYRILRWKGELWIAEIKSRFSRQGSSNTSKKAQQRVDHSVGNKQKPSKKNQPINKADQRAATAAVAAAADATLAIEVDGADPATRGETDISTFVEVLQKRGFVLQQQGPNNAPAVDMSNKMFVKMQFIKALSPTRGKGVPEKKAEGGVDSKEGGETWRRKMKGKFVERDEADEGEDEAGVLKPCVYKLR
ncbi:MAG: 25S rRNA (adenine645-N1)-methyltransferase [Pycnora praestabilis]|nr:MAG: 25S rRNA (adenine645-N1)-methyltransferase [Pycnora praestabilis]